MGIPWILEMIPLLETSPTLSQKLEKKNKLYCNVELKPQFKKLNDTDKRTLTY